MQQRFDDFKLEYAKSLANLDNKTFEQLKNAALVSLTEEPKNLAEESQPPISDWFKENMAFDSKAKLTAAVRAVTLQDIKDYYQQTVLNPDAARLNVQLRGEKFQSQPFADLKGQTKLESVKQLSETVSLQD